MAPQIIGQLCQCIEMANGIGVGSIPTWESTYLKLEAVSWWPPARDSHSFCINFNMDIRNFFDTTPGKFIRKFDSSPKNKENVSIKF